VHHRAIDYGQQRPYLALHASTGRRTSYDHHRYLTKVATATARLPYSLVNACGLSSPEGYAEAECDGVRKKCILRSWEKSSTVNERKVLFPRRPRVQPFSQLSQSIGYRPLPHTPIKSWVRPHPFLSTCSLDPTAYLFLTAPASQCPMPCRVASRR
jgi:hypothetical protein